MTQALYFVVKTLAQLYLLLYLLRFWMPWVRADFRNPIAQAILRFTSPVITPVRRFIPPIGKLDTATILVAVALQYLIFLLLLLIVGGSAGIATLLLQTLLELCILSLNLFFIAILVRIILSWVAPHTHNPLGALAGALAEPVLAPFRRLLPAPGGLDISPIFAFVLLKATEIYLNTLQPLPL